MRGAQVGQRQRLPRRDKAADAFDIEHRAQVEAFARRLRPRIHHQHTTLGQDAD